MTRLTEDTDILRLLRTMDLDRMRAYGENLDFYNGLQWPAGSRQRGRRLTFNYAKVLVDKVSSYCASINVEVTDTGDLSPGQLDLSQQAFHQLVRSLEPGVLQITIEEVNSGY